MYAPTIVSNRTSGINRHGMEMVLWRSPCGGAGRYAACARRRKPTAEIMVAPVRWWGRGACAGVRAAAGKPRGMRGV